MEKMMSYEQIRTELLRVHATGEVSENRWYLVGLSPQEKRDMMNLIISQVYCIKEVYPKMTWMTAVIYVKRRLSGIKLWYWADMHSLVKDRYDFIESFLNGDIFLEAKMFTKKLIPISRLEAENYENDNAIVKKDGRLYRWENALKMEFESASRTKYLMNKSGEGKQKRFDVLNNLIGESDNQYIQKYYYLEMLVDMYREFNHPYAEVILAYYNKNGAKYSHGTAYNLIKEFFIKAIRKFGGSRKDIENEYGFVSASEVFNLYSLLDLLSEERKHHHSVTDVMNG